MKTLKKIAVLLTLTSLAYLQACQEGCRPIDKSKERISEENRAKMAYTGTETLIFIEIDNGDSTELTFEPTTSFDSMLFSYSYYEAPNGDECIGYEFGEEVLYRKYQCQERPNWFFETAITGETEQVLLRFDELQYSDGKYNFEIFLSTLLDLHDNKRDTTSGIGSVYLGKYSGLNGLNYQTTRISFFESEEILFYDYLNGIVEWNMPHNRYSLFLKSITKN
ncbi:MAG: hypothetical protein ACPGLV_08180 [Bacteroidia bacterium]